MRLLFGLLIFSPILLVLGTIEDEEVPEHSPPVLHRPSVMGKQRIGVQLGDQEVERLDDDQEDQEPDGKTRRAIRPDDNSGESTGLLQRRRPNHHRRRCPVDEQGRRRCLPIRDQHRASQPRSRRDLYEEENRSDEPEEAEGEAPVAEAVDGQETGELDGIENNENQDVLEENQGRFRRYLLPPKESEEDDDLQDKPVKLKRSDLLGPMRPKHLLENFEDETESIGQRRGSWRRRAFRRRCVYSRNDQEIGRGRRRCLPVRDRDQEVRSRSRRHVDMEEDSSLEVEEADGEAPLAEVIYRQETGDLGGMGSLGGSENDLLPLPRSKRRIGPPRNRFSDLSHSDEGNDDFEWLMKDDYDVETSSRKPKWNKWGQPTLWGRYGRFGGWRFGNRRQLGHRHFPMRYKSASRVQQRQRSQKERRNPEPRVDLEDTKQQEVIESANVEKDMKIEPWGPHFRNRGRLTQN